MFWLCYGAGPGLGFGRGAEHGGAELLVEAEEGLEAGQLRDEGLGALAAVYSAVEGGVGTGQGRGYGGGVVEGGEAFTGEDGARGQHGLGCVGGGLAVGAGGKGSSQKTENRAR